MFVFAASALNHIDASPAWPPDGRYLLYTRQQRHNPDLMLIENFR